jgi:hypothetical protein
MLRDERSISLWRYEPGQSNYSHTKCISSFLKLSALVVASWKLSMLSSASSHFSIYLQRRKPVTEIWVNDVPSKRLLGIRAVPTFALEKTMPEWSSCSPPVDRSTITCNKCNRGNPTGSGWLLNRLERNPVCGLMKVAKTSLSRHVRIFHHYRISGLQMSITKSSM